MGKTNNTARREDVIDLLAEEWASAGLSRGRVVLLHSRTLRTLKRLASMGTSPDPDIILDSFLRVVGPDGTLLMPLFNFDFASGKPFDIRRTPSQMGVLTETARRRAGAVRTGHPIYSFCALGAQAGLFAGVCNYSGYGQDSPFGIVHRVDGQLAVLDLPEVESVTFVHYVEECAKVSYRYHKEFRGLYTDESGVTAERVFSLYVRDIARGVVGKGNEMGELIWQGGHYKGFKPHQGPGLRTISASVFFDQIMDIILSGRARGLLYDIERTRESDQLPSPEAKHIPDG